MTGSETGSTSNPLSAMSPGHKPQNSAISGEGYDALGDMGANTRVQRVTWHPAQDIGKSPISGGAPVRTVHYIPYAKGVRHSPRMSKASALSKGQ